MNVLIPIDKILMYNAIESDKENNSIVECIIREVSLYTVKENDKEYLPDKLIKKNILLLLIPFNKTGVTINITDYKTFDDLFEIVVNAVCLVMGKDGLLALFDNNETAVRMFRDEFLQKYINEFINKKETEADVEK